MFENLSVFGVLESFYGWTEEDNKYTRMISLPGVKKDGLTLTLRGKEILEVKAEGKIGKKEFGMYLPVEAESKDISAKLEDGILVLSIPSDTGTSKVKVE